MTAPRLLTALVLLAAAGTAEAASLTLEFVKATDMGATHAALFNDPAQLPTVEAAMVRVIVAKDGPRVVTLHDLPPGRYAITAFQDINGNDVLDRNLLGMPAEPVFEDAGFDLTDDARKAIRLR